MNLSDKVGQIADAVISLLVLCSMSVCWARGSHAAGDGMLTSTAPENLSVLVPGGVFSCRHAVGVREVF